MPSFSDPLLAKGGDMFLRQCELSDEHGCEEGRRRMQELRKRPDVVSTVYFPVPFEPSYSGKEIFGVYRIGFVEKLVIN